MPRLPNKAIEVLFLLIALFALPFAARGQDSVTAPPPLSPQQIDQMVAPVALYPDQLLGQILMAATYPLEVVEANRWLERPQNARLQGDQLQAALAQQPWDPSVKSLVEFPQVLKMMDSNLQWTEQLGNSFLAQQEDVMNSVQNLRQRAVASGHLDTTPQQTVLDDNGEIVIQPANPQVVYVPAYNPDSVYGAWPYPDYPPYGFSYPGYYYSAPGVVGFGVGIVVANWLWGWNRWDWHRHRIDIDDHRFEHINGGHAPSVPGRWEHNPEHRHGVPYASPPVRAQFQEPADRMRRDFRGYTTVSPRVGGPVPNTAAHEPQTVRRATPPVENIPQPLREIQTPHRVVPPQTNVAVPNTAIQHEPPTVRRAAPVENIPQTHYEPRQQPVFRQPQQERPAPVFESLSHGPDVRMQSQRGAYSRSTMPHAAPQPAPRQPAPSGGDKRKQDTRYQ
ncbi:MAG: DUF3300 domain-containing protein [Alphaproteobacteria bacterium]|nr:DUF3300 domain-containing protein [Alphaproteobacteria bacterium]